MCGQLMPCCCLRRARAPRWVPSRSSGVGAPAGWTQVDATDQRLRFHGRSIASEGSVRFDWPATTFCFVTTAPRVILRLDGGRSFFNIIIDGRQAGVLETSAGFRDYSLELHGAAGESLVPSRAPLPRLIELQKRTESRIGACLGRNTNVATLRALFLETSEELLDPPALPARRLEFVGDSETAGFGNEGPSEPGPPRISSLLKMRMRDQDAMLSWPAFVAKELGADFHNIAWSGMGVLWNAPHGSCSAARTMQQAYTCLLGGDVDGQAAARQISAEDAWMPDAVVIYIGGNDWYSLRPDSPGLRHELAGACAEFLRIVRTRRPRSAIVILVASPESFCACIGTLEEQAQYSSDMEQCWRSAARDVDDPNVHVEMVRPSPIIDVTNRSDWGQMGHWSVQGNNKWAKAAAPLIAKHLGQPRELRTSSAQ